MASKTEEYVVKFWFKKDDGFFEQRKESVRSTSKNQHDLVEREFKKKYLAEGHQIKIISIIYQ